MNSRAWKVFLCKHTFKIIPKIQCGVSPLTLPALGAPLSRPTDCKWLKLLLRSWKRRCTFTWYMHTDTYAYLCQKFFRNCSVYIREILMHEIGQLVTSRHRWLIRHASGNENMVWSSIDPPMPMSHCCQLAQYMLMLIDRRLKHNTRLVAHARRSTRRVEIRYVNRQVRCSQRVGLRQSTLVAVGNFLIIVERKCKMSITLRTY